MDAELVTADTTSAPTEPVSPLEAERSKYFFSQYLPSQKVLPGFHTPEQYIALPENDRRKLINGMVEGLAKEEKWTQQDLRETRKADIKRYLWIDRPNREAPKERSVLEAVGAFGDAVLSGASQTAGKAANAIGELTDSPRLAATGKDMTAYGDAIDKSRANELPAVEARLARETAAVLAAAEPDAGVIADAWRGITKGANAAIADPLAFGGKLIAGMAPSIAAAKAAAVATPGPGWLKAGAGILAGLGVGAVRGQR